jgi:hypothetical protein
MSIYALLTLRHTTIRTVTHTRTHAHTIMQNRVRPPPLSPVSSRRGPRRTTARSSDNFKNTLSACSTGFSRASRAMVSRSWTCSTGGIPAMGFWKEGRKMEV